ncbi:uncharacterized protein LOC129301697 [Prosopis cineraria]|uniref:uncharacterized protein LOC129301697 n=1 Tax=Prosopis cineraria TaxID=364024 RepID=UPI00240FA156|nr:uncharacterized protein LOC129301697 [Prosopis cineraria]
MATSILGFHTFLFSSTTSILAKPDSEVSSLSQSSPGRSPRHSVHYAMSSYRDSSHHGEMIINSFHSSPLQSPLGFRPTPTPTPTPYRAHIPTSPTLAKSRSPPLTRKALGDWKHQFHATEEEGPLDPHDFCQHGLPRRKN